MSSSNNNNSNITYEDYDWMGVLDNLDDHSFTLDNNSRLRLDSIDNQLAAASNNSTSQLNSSEIGQQHHEEAVANLLTSQQPQSQGVGQNDVSASMNDGGGVAMMAEQQKQQASSSASSSTATNEQKESTMPSLPSNNINPPLISQPQSSTNSSLPQPSYNNSQQQPIQNYKESEALKKERKRHREKQRRLDTNEQFNALADIVKDIDNFDFNNEALFCLELYGPNNGPGEVNCRVGGMNGGGKSDVWEGMNHQQQQAGPTLDNDPHSSSKKLKSDFNINNNMTSLPPLPNPSSLGNRNGGSGSKTLPQSTTTTLPTTTSHPIISGTSTSNRIDLIARTISQLSTFRNIRNTRNNELRLEKRKVCELKKENEELRRMVAHYKTVGMGKRLQEKVCRCLFVGKVVVLFIRHLTFPFVHFPLSTKIIRQVMMMVPMMVPQDQVSQIQQGYAVPHHSYGTSAAASAAGTPSHFATTAAATASPWATTQPIVYHQPQPSTVAAGAGVGGHHPQQLNHSVSAPPDLQQGGLTTTHGAPGDNNSQAPPLPSGAGDQQAQQQLPPTQVQEAASHAAAAYPVQQQQQQVMVTQQQLAPQQLATTTTMAPPAMAMYPQVTNGVPSVAFGLHPHQPQMMSTLTPHVHPPNMTQPQAMMGVATNNNAPQDGSTVDSAAQLNGLPTQQQGFDRQASQGSTSSDKPAAAAPPQVGGGGNLAHCA